MLFRNSSIIGFVVFVAVLQSAKPVPAMILSLGNALVLPLVLMVLLWNTGLDGLRSKSTLTSLLISVIAIIVAVKILKSGLSKRK